jgi:hypothetical protein
MALVMLLFWMQTGWSVDDSHDPESLSAWLNELSLAPLDLNTASADDLARLPTLDPRLARAIVRHRTRRGAFRDMSELARVSGIDAEHIEAVRPYLRIRWRDAWHPTGAAFLRSGQYRGHATAGPLSVFRSSSRQFLSLEHPRLSGVLGDHRVSTGLGLLQHQGLRADPSLFAHNRHGTRLRGNTSTSTEGWNGVAGSLRYDIWELSAFRGGARLQLSDGAYNGAITMSAGGVSHDGTLLPATIPLLLAYEFAAHDGKTAFLSELVWKPAPRFRITARVLDVSRGYDAPNSLIAVRFGRRPMGEHGAGVGVAWNGFHASVWEARSKNSLHTETDITARLGYSDSKRMVDWSADRVKGVVRFGAPPTWRGEVGIEVRGRGVGGRAVLDVRPAKGIRVWMMSGVFEAEAWKDRVYGWEPDGAGRGKIVAWYGAGRREVGAVELGPWKGLVLSAKAGVTRYSDRWGPDATRSEAVMQLNWGF